MDHRALLSMPPSSPFRSLYDEPNLALVVDGGEREERPSRMRSGGRQMSPPSGTRCSLLGRQ
ncbi:hypothetical protein GWI33_003988, partial [Rhynchophorus ferrugineus]